MRSKGDEMMKYEQWEEMSPEKKFQAARWEANAETNNATTKQDFKNILKYLVMLIEEDKCPSCQGNSNKLWTPIKREWPKKRGRYLVTYREWSNGDYLPEYDSTYVKILRFDEAIFKFPKCIDKKAEVDINREVIAWIPLPEPYNVEVKE
jgi:Ni/Co efflux regulator RcnB